MPPETRHLNRRLLLVGTALALAPTTVRGQDATPAPTAVPPSLAGTTLRLLTWQRPVDGFNDAYETLVRNWADRNGVGLTIDWMAPATMVDAVSNEIAVGSGHDLIDTPLPMPQAEPAMRDLTDLDDELRSTWGDMVEACDQSTLNPVTGRRWGIAAGWEPAIAMYRATAWQEAGYPFGPRTLDELTAGARWIWNERGLQLALGLTPTHAAEITAQNFIWATGGGVQDANEQVVLKSQSTMAALTAMRTIFLETMTPVVLEWKNDDYVEFMLNGFGSYTIGGLHNLRSIAARKPEIATDLWIAPPITGPAGTQPARAMVMAMPTLMIPAWNPTPTTAEALVREMIVQSGTVARASQLTYLPAFPGSMPDLNALLADDPFDDILPTRLAPLAEAPLWTASGGWPGPLNPMIAEGHRQGLLVSMLADGATETMPDADAIAFTADAFELLAEPWRAAGLMAPVSTDSGVG